MSLQAPLGMGKGGPPPRPPLFRHPCLCFSVRLIERLRSTRASKSRSETVSIADSIVVNNLYWSTHYRWVVVNKAQSLPDHINFVYIVHLCIYLLGVRGKSRVLKESRLSFQQSSYHIEILHNKMRKLRLWKTVLRTKLSCLIFS